MVRKAVFSLLLTLLWGSPLVAEQWAQEMFETSKHDFGSVARDAKAEYAFELTNSYVEDVHISSVRASCGCTSVKIAKPLLKTYEKGAIIAHINTDRFTGQKGATITVTFDKPYYATAQLHVDAFIRSDVVFDPGSVQFGCVERGAAVEKVVTVTSTGRARWQIVDVTTANPHLSVRMEEMNRGRGRTAYRLFVRLDENMPAGYFSDPLMLVTNDRRSSQIPLEVNGVVEPGIAISPASLFLGVLSPGEKVTKQLVVRAKTPFRIISITSDGGRFEFGVPPETVAKPLHLIPVTFIAGPNPGKVLRKIRIETDLDEPTPELLTHAVISPQNGIALDTRQ